MGFSSAFAMVYGEALPAQLIYLFVWALAIAFHIIIPSFVLGLNYHWQFGARSQEQCKDNVMEMETTRYNVYSYLANDKKLQERRVAIIVLFSILMLFTVPPMLLVITKVFYEVSRFASALGGNTYLSPFQSLDALMSESVFSYGFLGFVTIFSFAIFINLKSKDLVQQWFPGYKTFIKSVNDKVVRPISDTKNKNCMEKSRTTICRMFNNIATNIQLHNEMPSFDAAKLKLRTLVAALGSSDHSTDVFKYICFNAASRDHQIIKDLNIPGLPDYNTLTKDDPSDQVKRMLHKWLMYMFIIYALLAYLLFHWMYNNVDRGVIVAVCVILPLFLAFIGYNLQYSAV